MLYNIFSQIQNGFLAKKTTIVLKIKSKILINFLNILIKEGYIYGYKILKNNFIIIYLKYINNKPAIIKIKKINFKKYIKKKKLIFLKTSLHIYIISTSKGLMSHKEALKQQLGGCLICKII